MSREQIEQKRKDLIEMAEIGFPFLDVVKPEFYNTAIFGNIHVIKPIENLYNAGYRKQSEGEWRYNPNGMDWGLGAWECSVCHCNNTNLPMDKNINPMRWAGAKFCPNCGAKMKGGAE